MQDSEVTSSRGASVIDSLHTQRVFLTAEWRDLLMLNYEVDPGLVLRHVPSGTELDSFGGKTYVSVVGFKFCRTRLLGRFAIPYHSDFNEVNLRFYVRRRVRGELRRGVVFIVEVVPKRMVAFVARRLYGENYMCSPMNHSCESEGANKALAFRWQIGGRWCGIAARSVGVPAPPLEGSLQQFITEHYWGYSLQPDGGCIEYQVAHAPWRLWTTESAELTGDTSYVYGSELAKVVQRRPDSAFIAEGSPVTVYRGEKVQ